MNRTFTLTEGQRALIVAALRYEREIETANERFAQRRDMPAMVEDCARRMALIDATLIQLGFTRTQKMLDTQGQNKVQ